MAARAAIDIGSNSVLLLVCDDGILANEARITSLGKGIDTTHLFSADSMNATVQALSEYHKIIQSFGISSKKVIVTATEASRVAKNSKLFFEAIKERFGFEVKIITSEAEAYFTALGVAADYQKIKGLDEIIIMDIGGASTELIRCTLDTFNIEESISLPVGAVRANEWIIDQSFSEKIASLLQNQNVKKYKTSQLVCVAGTMTSIVAMILELEEYDDTKIHNFSISQDKFCESVAKFSSITSEKLLIKFPFLGKRSENVVAGLKVALSFIEVLEVKKIIISTKGLRYGTILNERLDERFISK